ncbi:Uncharacterised protein [Bordetella pertussis]|nr:Uncharacterised protein [Bordetella pertussis]
MAVSVLPTLAGATMATCFSITPSSTRRRTRRRQVGGEACTRAASSWLVRVQSRCIWSRMRRSRSSKGTEGLGVFCMINSK